MRNFGRPGSSRNLKIAGKTEVLKKKMMKVEVILTECRDSKLL